MQVPESYVCRVQTLYQYIKEYKVGHGARKRDHFARAKSMINNFVNPPHIHILLIQGEGDR